jgi:hypothetical protein
VSHFLRFKSNHFEYGSTKSKSKSSITNLITFLDFITHILCFRCQANAIYFDRSRAFDLVPHAVLLYNLGASKIPGGFVNYFRRYIPNPTDILKTLFVEFFPRLLKHSPVFIGDPFWSLCFSVCLLITYVMQ